MWNAKILSIFHHWLSWLKCFWLLNTKKCVYLSIGCVCGWTTTNAMTIFSQWIDNVCDAQHITQWWCWWWYEKLFVGWTNKERVCVCVNILLACYLNRSRRTRIMMPVMWKTMKKLENGKNNLAHRQPYTEKII